MKTVKVSGFMYLKVLSDKIMLKAMHTLGVYLQTTLVSPEFSSLRTSPPPKKLKPSVTYSPKIEINLTIGDFAFPINKVGAIATKRDTLSS